MGLLLLILIISGLVLLSWFFIETQFNDVIFVKFYKIVNNKKNTFLKNSFIYTMLFYFIKYLWMSLISSISVVSWSTLKS